MSVPIKANQLMETEELMTTGAQPGRIVEALAARHNVTDRTVYRWMAKVKEAWTAAAEESRQVRRAQLRTMYMHSYRAAHNAKPKQLSAAISAIKGIAVLDGLDEPFETRILPAGPDLKLLTQGELDQLEALTAKASGDAE